MFKGEFIGLLAPGTAGIGERSTRRFLTLDVVRARVVGQRSILGNASVTWGENSKMARRSLSLQGFSGPSVSDGGRDSVEPPYVTEGYVWLKKRLAPDFNS